MKKIILTLIFSINAFAQITFNEFPKIGFNDMFQLANAPMYCGGYPNQTTYNLYSDPTILFYYSKLRELGLTHIVTTGGAYNYPGDPGNPGFYINDIPLEPAYNPTLKVLDLYFTARLSRYDASNPMFLGGVYAAAQGNSRLNERYEVGGNIATYFENNNFGFGTTSLTSVWVTNPPAIGFNTTDPNNPTKTVFFATTASHSSGNLLEAELPEYHQGRTPGISSDITDSVKYRLILNARIDGYTNSGDMDTVALVTISESIPTSSLRVGAAPFKGYRRNHYPSVLNPAITLTTPTNFTYAIRVKDFGGNNYVNLSSPYFYKNNGQEDSLIITVYWKDKKNMYIDHFYIFDNFYERMFIVSDPTPTFNSIKTQLQNTFGSVVTNSLYSHFYYDEPWPNSYRSVNKLSELSNQKFSLNKYVNGAVGDYYKHMLQYGNSQGRLPYIMSDKYPFWYNVGTGTVEVQKALDSLIYAPRPNNDTSGLRVAINMSQNFTPAVPTDDVPFIATIQVQAEKLFEGGIITDNRFRAPTANEIKVQGFLSICYGAKGLAYYTINTQSPHDTDHALRLATYGLFDQQGNAYNDSPLNGLHQDPATQQIVNSRFTAVKELNSAIDKFSSELLQVTWTNGYNIHVSQPSGTFISNIKSYTTSNILDSNPLTYVELGTFKKTNEFTNKNLDYFFVVNRRTNITELRKITVTFNRTSALYNPYSLNNWKISEVGTSNVWYISKTGNFQTTYQPGEGKLFKMEPIMIIGGTLVYDENIPAMTNIGVKGSITVPLGRTITAGSGCIFTFNNNSSLIINGTLTSSGTLNYKITYDFVTPLGTNGIRIIDGSSSILYSIIKNASTGIYIDESYVTVDNCEIFGCLGGISINGTNNIPNDPIIRNNYIHDAINMAVGIYCYNSSPSIINNQIKNYYGGITLSTYSTASFGGVGVRANNYVHHNTWGFQVSDWSNPILGRDGVPPEAGWNIIEYNTKHISVYNCTVIAEKNWWGSNPPDGSKIVLTLPGSIDYQPWLESRPTLSLMKESASSQEIVNADSPNQELGAYGDKWPIFWKLQYARNQIAENQYASAQNICKEVLESFPDSNLSFYALDLLWQASRKFDVESFKSFLSQKINEGENSPLCASMELILANYKKEDKINKLDNLIANYKSDDIVRSALFSKFLYYFYRMEDLEKAKEVSGELNKLFPGSYSALDTKMILGEGGKYISKNNIDENSELSLPKEYSLLGNYPNPFNPSTTISYSLPYQSSVELVIYDLMGKEIKSFFISPQSQGYQHIFWDGRNNFGEQVSSGVYLYRIKLHSLENGKEFIKVAKLMIIK